MGIFSELKDSLKKTRESFFKRVKKLLSLETLDADAIEEIEELLILSDMGSEDRKSVV